jgi:hypothetical protein
MPSRLEMATERTQSKPDWLGERRDEKMMGGLQKNQEGDKGRGVGNTQYTSYT